MRKTIEIIENFNNKNLNMSTLFQSNGLIFFVIDRGVFQVFIHKKNINKYCSEVSPLTLLQKSKLLPKTNDSCLDILEILCKRTSRKSDKISMIREASESPGITIKLE